MVWFIKSYPRLTRQQDYDYQRLPLHWVFDKDYKNYWLQQRNGSITLDYAITVLIESFPQGANQLDCHRNLPIDLAIKAKVSKDIFLILLNATRVFATRKDDDERLPLHRLFDCKEWNYLISADVVNLLIESYPDGPNQIDEYGKLPIDLAIKAKVSKEIFLILFHATHDFAKKKGSTKQLPLHRLFDCKEWNYLISLDVVNSLIEAYPDGLNQRNKYGELPINCLIGCVEKKRANISQDIFQSMLNATPHFALQNYDGKSELIPLLYVLFHFKDSRHMKDDCVQNILIPLIESYPATAQKKAFGKLPIFLACKIKSVSREVVEALIIAFPAGLRETREREGLPIHMACKHGASVEVVEVLINSYLAGVSTPTRRMNCHGTLPIHLACQRKELDHRVIGALVKAAPETLAETATYGDNNTHNHPRLLLTPLQMILRKYADDTFDETIDISLNDMVAYVIMKAIIQGIINLHAFGAATVSNCSKNFIHDIFDAATEQIKSPNNKMILPVLNYLLTSIPIQASTFDVHTLFHNISLSFAQRCHGAAVVVADADQIQEEGIEAANILYHVLKVKPHIVLPN